MREWDMSSTRIHHVTHNERFMSPLCDETQAAWDTHEWFMSCRGIRHVTHMNKSCPTREHGISQCGAVWCSVLRCVAMCCSVLQCVAVCCSVLQCVAVCFSVLQCVAVCCSVNCQIMSHTWIRHIIHMNALRHTFEYTSHTVAQISSVTIMSDPHTHTHTHTYIHTNCGVNVSSYEHV